VKLLERPLKLALVSRNYPPSIGGAERVLSYLADALALEGADVTVLTAQLPHQTLSVADEMPGESERANGKARFKLVRLPTLQRRFLGTWHYMVSLQQWFADQPIDLAYVSMLKHDAYMAVGAGRRWGFPVVLRPEGAGVTGDVAWQTRGNFGRMIALRCRSADAFVAISASVEAELREALQSGIMRGLPFGTASQVPCAPRIVAIPNGVPVPHVPWQPRAEYRRAPRAVFVGRLAQEKGLDTLINAWPHVRAKYPAARLTLVGEGPQRAALETRARALRLTLGPDQAVELPGATNDATQILRTADLFVLPSLEEGMSIALLEAMALGMPLVASSIPGNSSLIANVEEGRLVPPGDAEALGRVIVEIWDNLELAMQMGSAARRRVEGDFSIQMVARRHLTLFEEIIRARG
jgi:glycosyltransferase involved in cell wall biosynthesis